MKRDEMQSEGVPGWSRAAAAKAMEVPPEQRDEQQQALVAEHDRRAQELAAKQDAQVKAKRAAASALGAQARKLHQEATWIEKHVLAGVDPVAEELRAMNATVEPARAHGRKLLRALKELSRELQPSLDKIAAQPWRGLIQRAPRLVNEIVAVEESVLALKETIKTAVAQTERRLAREFTSSDLRGMQARALGEVQLLLRDNWPAIVLSRYETIMVRLEALQKKVEKAPTPAHATEFAKNPIRGQSMPTLPDTARPRTAESGGFTGFTKEEN